VAALLDGDDWAKPEEPGASVAVTSNIFFLLCFTVLS
jgi:hypothetical protein